MSLKIYCASRFENLARKLKDCLLSDRQGKDPFHFSKVVVPNANVAKWLQIRFFAKEPDLCAGVNFPFMEKELTGLMVSQLPQGESSDVELLPDRAYTKAIAAILLAGPGDQPEFEKLAPFREYITADSAGKVAITEQNQAAMVWQLAEKLADLMDSYEVYRPEIVESWLTGCKCPYDLRTGEAAEAEAALARALWGEKGRFRPSGKRLSLRQLFNRVKTGAPGGKPKTIYFFGQSTLSVLQAQILVWLAKTHEIAVFYLNPCREFWGDIETVNEKRKALFKTGGASGGDPEDDFVCENELLRTLGVAGRETLRMLVELEETADTAERIGFDWVSVDDGEERGTVLGRVQESIRRRTGEIERVRQDATVQVVGTPGVRREVEMVYNSILGSVARPDGVKGERPWPDCSFSDIAVIVPDMKTYRPVIEAVFDARGEVPYGLLDTSASDDSDYLRGFLALLELGRKGLNRERLFGVLESAPVQRALGFSRQDVAAWRELTKAIGAFDGFEHDDENAQGYFDWSSALKRMRLARFADASAVAGGGDLPLVNAPGGAALKFSETVELLHRDLAETLFDSSHRPRELPLACARREDGTRADCWAERLARLARTYLAVEKDDMLEGKVSEALIGTLYSLGEIPGVQSFELAAAAIEQFAGGIPCRKGGFLTSGVTIGGFSSLCTIPFKQVYIMGLGAGGYPGGASDSTLDVRGTGWRLGDVSTPNRNRFLLLEAIMSARDRLVISYPSKDIEKDAELFQAGVVAVLEKFIGERVLKDGEAFGEYRGYPLLEHGEAGPRKAGEARATDDIIWSADDPFAGILPTYSKAARELARARIEGVRTRSEAIETTDETPGARVELSAKALSAFLKNPVRAVMRYRFGITIAGYSENDLETASPIGLPEGPDGWRLEEKWLEADAAGEVAKEIRRLQLSGRMPAGFLGEYAKSTFMQDAAAKANAIGRFVAGFSPRGAKPDALHIDWPVEFKAGEAGGLKARFTADVPNWSEGELEATAVVTGWLGEKPPELPVESCFDAFLAYLMALSAKKCTAGRLKIGVADLKHGTTGAWIWSGITPEKASSYLEALSRAYLASGKSDGGMMTDLSSKKLLKALNGARPPYDWDEILVEMSAEEYTGSSGEFNNNLVLEQNLERFKRKPETGEELRGVYEARYEMLLGATRLTAAEMEAGNE